MSCHEFIRPDPDDLLRKLEEQDAQRARGRLKIFLGYAPRVGKSVRMFDEGRRRAKRGQDVVVGAIQTKGFKDVQPFVQDLEVIPYRVLNGEHALDVDAILRRAPDVCLIDELARDNPPDSRHAHRWQDVEQLVAAGITVLTALNLQYVEEHQEAIERITSRRARRSVPQSFIHSADEIVVVDVPAEGLVHNGGSGNLEAHQLSELRELALLLAAAVVEGQLLRYMKSHGIRQSWGTQERIQVCITPHANARPMLESGARAANRFHAQLFAVYVDRGNLTREAQETLDGYVDYARKLGADVQVLQTNQDPIAAMLQYAREQRITQVFIARAQRSPWKFWARDPIECLIKAAEGMDVRIFPSTQPG